MAPSSVQRTRSTIAPAGGRTRNRGGNAAWAHQRGAVHASQPGPAAPWKVRRSNQRQKGLTPNSHWWAPKANTAQSARPATTTPAVRAGWPGG